MAITPTYNDPSDMAVEDYLYGCVGYSLSNEEIARILLDNDILPKTPACELTTKQKDFLKISVYEAILLQPSMTASIADANGSWSHKEGATEANSTDREFMKKKIRELKKKYGIKVESSIKVATLGMKVWQGIRN